MVEIYLSKILFDNSMKSWVKENCDETAKKRAIRMLPKRIIQSVGSLNNIRLDSIQNAYNSMLENKLPDILLKRYIYDNGIPSSYFMIIDGRHRVVKALYNNMERINAEILS